MGEKRTKQSFRNAFKDLGLRLSSLEIISIWWATERSSLSSSKNHIQVLHNPSQPYQPWGRTQTSGQHRSSQWFHTTSCCPSVPRKYSQCSCDCCTGRGSGTEHHWNCHHVSGPKLYKKWREHMQIQPALSQHAQKSLENKPLALLFPTCALYIIHRPLVLALINSDVET